MAMQSATLTFNTDVVVLMHINEQVSNVITRQLPGYYHNHAATVVDGDIYVGRNRLSHREVPLMEAQPEAELILQVLQHFCLHERSVMVAAKKNFFKFKENYESLQIHLPKTGNSQIFKIFF